MATSIPAQQLIPAAFANQGDSRVIPLDNTDASNPQNASWNQGFPEITSTPLESGGLPPERLDMNGVLNTISSNQARGQQGGQVTFDPAVANSISGYALGALLWYFYNDGGIQKVKPLISLKNNNLDNFNSNPAFIDNTTSWLDLFDVFAPKSMSTADIAPDPTRIQAVTTSMPGSGSSYTAPADGWFFLAIQANDNSSIALLASKTSTPEQNRNNALNGVYATATTSNKQMMLSLYVRAGTVVTYQQAGGGGYTFLAFNFITARGYPYPIPVPPILPPDPQAMVRFPIAKETPTQAGQSIFYTIYSDGYIEQTFSYAGSPGVTLSLAILMRDTLYAILASTNFNVTNKTVNNFTVDTAYTMNTRPSGYCTIKGYVAASVMQQYIPGFTY